jgi:hypothetical protein
VSDVGFLVLVGGGFAALAAGAIMRRRARDEAAEATGLLPADLSHLPAVLRETVLWKMCDGGFESGVLAGELHRGTVDVEVTAFELETLRERRGEWAYLPIDQPFRVDGKLRVVVFRLPRVFPHLVLKRKGDADLLPKRTPFEVLATPTAAARMLLGLGEGVESERPDGVPFDRLDAPRLPELWRAYGTDAVFLTEMLREPLVSTLAEEGSPDQVIELLGDMVVVYHARERRMRDFGDAGETPWPRMAQYLIDDGLQVVDAIAKVTAAADARGVRPG